MDFLEVTGKTVDDAITEACRRFLVTSDRLEYEVIEKGTSGFLGFAAKPAVIKARVICEDNNDVNDNKSEAVLEDNTSKVVEDNNNNEVNNDSLSDSDPKEFLLKVFDAMGLKVNVDITEKDGEMNIDLSGDEMGVLIGKRGQTLDSLQYLTSLVVNKGTKEYVRVKVDTENYRERRKETLENLAKNLAYKVKRTKKAVSLEPMNPYERRIIHSALQNDKYVTTISEGEEPYRKVVIKPVK